MEQRLLAVDDDPRVLAAIARIAASIGVKAKTTPSGFEFMEIAETFKPTVCAIDIHMPELDGIELIRWLGSQNVDAKILMMNELGPVFAKCSVALGRHFGLGQISVLSKPFEAVAFRNALLQALPKDQAGASPPNRSCGDQGE